MYEWTDDMPLVTPERGLEPHYRAAITAAATALEAQVTAAEEPAFSHGRHSSPKNASARFVVDAIEVALAVFVLEVTGAKRQQLITYAIRCAHVVRQGGFGPAGWHHMLAWLAAPGR